MTSAATTPVDAGRSRLGRLPVVPVAVALVVLARLVQFRHGGSPDEGGFLVVAGQWHPGSSLYGDYWVDRPPLLIGLFRLADMFGGIPALRVLGALAAAATVALLASSAKRAFGPGAAGWTAVVAAAFLATPLFRAQDVNGELLALPFIALGIRAAIEAAWTPSLRAARTAALVAGAAAVAAVLVKQNMADVVVFAAICWIVSWRTGRVSGRLLVELIAAATAGAVLAYAVLMAWTWTLGTSPLDVYEATYPFRIKAAAVMTADTTGAEIQLGKLIRCFSLSGAPLGILGFLILGLRDARSRAVGWGVLGLLAYGAFSILVGGSYWLHYLVQLVPAVALGIGATAVAARGRTARGLLQFSTVVIVASSLIGAAIVTINPRPERGTAIGHAIARSAQPGDTLTTLFGDAEIQRSSGLSSPYPYLWSLPANTLDPDLSELDRLLQGPTAPTWVIIRGGTTTESLRTRGALRTITERYRRMSVLCGVEVYLQKTLVRPAPHPDGICSPQAP